MTGTSTRTSWARQLRRVVAAVTVAALALAFAATPSQAREVTAKASCQTEGLWRWGMAEVLVINNTVQVTPTNRPAAIAVVVVGVMRGSGKARSTGGMNFNTSKITSREVPWLDRTRPGTPIAGIGVIGRNGEECSDASVGS